MAWKVIWDKYMMGLSEILLYFLQHGTSHHFNDFIVMKFRYRLRVNTHFQFKVNCFSNFFHFGFFWWSPLKHVPTKLNYNIINLWGKIMLKWSNLDLFLVYVVISYLTVTTQPLHTQNIWHCTLTRSPD